MNRNKTKISSQPTICSSQVGLVVLPDCPAPLGTDTVKFWPALTKYAISGETEVGLCTCFGRPRQIEHLERHQNTPEILVPLDGDFLLPVAAVDQPETQNGVLSAEGVEVIRVKAGTAVVLSSGVWHWAVWPHNRQSVTYLVMFRSHTPNEDLEIKEVKDMVQF
jgi:ureidoglycolate hydrolase